MATLTFALSGPLQAGPFQAGSVSHDCTASLEEREHKVTAADVSSTLVHTCTHVSFQVQYSSIPPRVR